MMVGRKVWMRLFCHKVFDVLSTTYPLVIELVRQGSSSILLVLLGHTVDEDNPKDMLASVK